MNDVNEDNNDSEFFLYMPLACDEFCYYIHQDSHLEHSHFLFQITMLCSYVHEYFTLQIIARG